MKAQQLSGRKGSARIAFELKERNPGVPVTGRLLYLALHTNNDCICPIPAISDNIDKIKDKAVANPSSTLLDLDNDPVAEVCGVDNNGRVRWFPTGICKRGHLASAPAWNQLQIQRQAVSNDLEQVTAMRSQLEKPESLISRLTSTGGSNMTCGAGPSNMDIRQEFDDGYRPIVEKSCSLYSMRGEHVASGRAITGGAANEQESFEFYEVILDIVFVPSAPSTNMTTLGHEDIGSSIKWPKYFTRFTN